MEAEVCGIQSQAASNFFSPAEGQSSWGQSGVDTVKILPSVSWHTVGLSKWASLNIELTYPVQLLEVKLDAQVKVG